jgi:transcriptional regulator with XRE-family HTH domain
MITSAQIRAGRALLKWSAQDLADRTGMSRAAIERVETADHPAGKFWPSESKRIWAAFENAHVLFIGHPDGSTGVMLRKCTRP